MSVDRVNHLNLGLVVLALGVALVLPFELFLLAYAVLGPLHYLTEISWLHDRGYFAPRKRDWVPLWVLGLAGAVFLPGVFGPEPVLLSIPVVGELFYDWRYDVAFLGLGVALALVLTENWLIRGLIVVVLFQVLSFFRAQPLFISMFAVYLPSLVHVCVFTGLFILWGALKGRSRSGYLVLVAFVAGGVAAVALPVGLARGAGEWAQTNFVGAFRSLMASVMIDFGDVRPAQAYRTDPFASETALRVVRFFAFVYTYHYLNWFSKTSVIGWHRIPLSRTVGIVLLWGLSIGLYFYDYGLGLSWLFSLSFAHVVLEFPLNHRSLHGIGAELAARLSPARTNV